MSFSRVSINGKRYYNIPGARVAYPSVTTILGMMHTRVGERGGEGRGEGGKERKIEK
jgi:hypothetical protein